MTTDAKTNNTPFRTAETRTAVLYVSPTHRRAVRMAAALAGEKIGEFAERLIEGDDDAIESVKKCFSLAGRA